MSKIGQRDIYIYTYEFIAFRTEAVLILNHDPPMSFEEFAFSIGLSNDTGTSTDTQVMAHCIGCDVGGAKEL